MYTVRLITAMPRAQGAPPESWTFHVEIDPAVFQDGITPADRVNQQNFLLEVQDAIARANALRVRLELAWGRAGVPPPPAPGPGQSVGGMRYEHPLQRLWVRVVTASGTYPQGMLIDQLSNIVRAEGGADQKVGAEARRRFSDLLDEMKAIEAELSRY